MKKCIPNDRCEYLFIKSYEPDWGTFWMGFKPSEVLPKYDIFDDGTIFIYIKKVKRFLWYKYEKIYYRNVSDIKITEIPIKKKCGEKYEK